MKEFDLDNILDLQSTFDVFDENMPHISGLNNWLLGVNGTFFIILINGISEFKNVFNNFIYQEIVFKSFFCTMFGLLIFLLFQGYIKYLIFRIRIKATPIKIAIKDHAVNGQRINLKSKEILNDTLKKNDSAILNEIVIDIELLLENSKMIEKDLKFLTLRRDKLISLLNKSIAVSIFLGCMLSLLFGVYLYYSIIQ
ncbi:hypothetical protein [Maribacter aquivivus]|uniref:hypothetical protein n=1 Tax=Maribacter aquivivus TaxID=228958 RepID=UPI00248FDB3B|nr:hypothetical protein [Maribacter aquivivus]